MRNLLYLLVRYSAIVLFIFLEIVSFYLIINYNKSQKEIWAHSSNLFTGSINQQVSKVQDYFNLQETNDSLLRENAKLLELIINYRVSTRDNAFQLFEQTDSVGNYNLIPTRICSQTLNLRNNYMTLCKGESDGIKVGMGVTSEQGIVGIVKATSENYATVLLLLHGQSRISAKIKSKNYFGNLIWNSSDINAITMMDVPKHANIEIGDTVITSGYSIVFPPELHIGIIEDVKVEKGGNNYNIKVELDYNLANLEYVYVVDFLETTEKKELIQKQDE